MEAIVAFTTEKIVKGGIVSFVLEVPLLKSPCSQQLEKNLQRKLHSDILQLTKPAKLPFNPTKKGQLFTSETNLAFAKLRKKTQPSTTKNVVLLSDDPPLRPHNLLEYTCHTHFYSSPLI